ncbi:MAG: hypothetical protein L3J39_08855, partial [Verrucomicrobiales bacterium]|nr:hypothetical protein [Verrucomicrobiales bacterium]
QSIPHVEANEQSLNVLRAVGWYGIRIKTLHVRCSDFETPARVINFSSISDVIPGSYLTLGIIAGTEGVVLDLKIQSNPKRRRIRETVEKVIENSIAELKELNINWETQSDDGWAVLVINTPLHRLLGEDNQLAFAYEFMEQAISNLNALKIKEHIKEAIPKDS